MSCRTQVGTEEWFLRSNKGIVASEPAGYRPIRPTDHKLMRARRVSFHEQKWVRSCERRGRGGHRRQYPEPHAGAWTPGVHPHRMTRTSNKASMRPPLDPCNTVSPAYSHDPGTRQM